jgi:hypothetical protein
MSVEKLYDLHRAISAGLNVVSEFGIGMTDEHGEEITPARCMNIERRLIEQIARLEQKRVPMKPVKYASGLHRCPLCSRFVVYPYCEECGQPLDWEV